MAVEHDLYKIIRNVDIYTDFEMFEVQVPINFLGTTGFSLPRGNVKSLYL